MSLSERLYLVSSSTEELDLRNSTSWGHHPGDMMSGAALHAMEGSLATEERGETDGVDCASDGRRTPEMTTAYRNLIAVRATPDVDNVVSSCADKASPLCVARSRTRPSASSNTRRQPVPALISLSSQSAMINKRGKCRR